MKTSRFSLALLLIGTVLASGCSTEPPNCSSSKTLDLVRKIIIDDLGGSELFTQEEMNKTMVFSNTRATSYDEKIKLYTCEGTLIAGNKYQLPIKYQSQINDDKRHLVQLNGILRRDRELVAVGIVSEIQEERNKTKKVESGIYGHWTGKQNKLEITQKDGKPYVSIIAFNERGCTGEIEGAATQNKNGLILEVENEYDEGSCKININIDGFQAKLTPDNCASYSGLHCGFYGELVKD